MTQEPTPAFTLQDAFEMGRDAGRAEREILDGEQRALEEGKARLKEMAVVLGVARWEIMRNPRECATEVYFKIFDWDLRQGNDVPALIERAKEYLRDR